MHVAILEALLLRITIHSLYKAHIAILKENKAFIKVSTKCSNFLNVFLEKKVLVLLGETNFNKYAIDLEDDKHLFYELICNLNPVKLEILKTYIKTYLKIDFI